MGIKPEVLSENDPFSSRESQKYQNPVPSREHIITCLSTHKKRLVDAKRLQQILKIQPEQQEGLRRRLIAMLRDQQLVKNRNDEYQVVDLLPHVTGCVEKNRDGSGWIIPSEKSKGAKDLYLHFKQAQGLFHGDEVKAARFHSGYRRGDEGIVLDVIKRSKTQLVGRCQWNESQSNQEKSSPSLWVEPIDKHIQEAIDITTVGDETIQDLLKKLAPGQYVRVEMLSYPARGAPATGRILEVLGDANQMGIATDIALIAHQIPAKFSRAILDESSNFGDTVSADTLPQRIDLTHLDFVTIDGETARDFDDAVYCERTSVSEDSCDLYVAIADVSHYVTPTSALDDEAQLRGNSVYFPDRVIPMLPESLSNGLCSLVPNEVRLVLVCKMTINELGDIVARDFFEATICSKARLTYQQVANYLASDVKDEKNIAAAIHQPIDRLYQLYQQLLQAKAARGAVEFEFPETKIIYNEEGRVADFQPTQRTVAHCMIEEYMLAANQTVATYLQENNRGALYRVHAMPSAEKISVLQDFLKGKGLSLHLTDGEPTPDAYNRLLQSVQGRPDAMVIQTMLLRSMQQAVYQPENKGHFSLAFDAYAHFTSPIRRYPDLLVHRSLKACIQNQATLKIDWNSIGANCSMTERRADLATRDVLDFLKCEFMQDKLGSHHVGTIISVTRFGFFVALSDIYVEGLVHINDLPRDHYQFNETRHSLDGKHGGKQFTIGDKVSICVARVDLEKRRIDFTLEDKS